MATTLLHLAVGLSAYLILKRYVEELEFKYFAFATILPDLDVLIDWILVQGPQKPAYLQG